MAADARKLPIEHRLFFSTLWAGQETEPAIAVGDRTHFAIKRAWAIEHLIRLPYTLNRRYYRKPKWSAQHLASFQHKPEETLPRLSEAWPEDGAAVVKEVWTFIADLIACIRQECPESDIGRVANYSKNH